MIVSFDDLLHIIHSYVLLPYYQRAKCVHNRVRNKITAYVKLKMSQFGQN